jgi:hypothetical protein
MSACLARPYAESAVPPPRPHLASQPALPKPVAGGQVSSGRQKRSHMAADAMTTPTVRYRRYTPVAGSRPSP